MRSCVNPSCENFSSPLPYRRRRPEHCRIGRGHPFRPPQPFASRCNGGRGAGRGTPSKNRPRDPGGPSHPRSAPSTPQRAVLDPPRPRSPRIVPGADTSPSPATDVRIRTKATIRSGSMLAAVERARGRGGRTSNPEIECNEVNRLRPVVPTTAFHCASVACIERARKTIRSDGDRRRRFRRPLQRGSGTGDTPREPRSRTMNRPARRVRPVES